MNDEKPDLEDMLKKIPSSPPEPEPVVEEESNYVDFEDSASEEKEFPTGKVVGGILGLTAACIIAGIASTSSFGKEVLNTLQDMTTSSSNSIEIVPSLNQSYFSEKYNIIDFDGYYVPSNLGLEAGNHTFEGIPFVTGYQIDTSCRYNNDISSNSYKIQTDISNPNEIYFLIQAGEGVDLYEGDTIGNIVLSYENGERTQTNLVLGENIRDWAIEHDFAISTITSQYVREAWSGRNTDGELGRIDMLTIPVPEYLRSSKLTSITINDKSESINPCIHVTGITVKYLGE